MGHHAKKKPAPRAPQLWGLMAEFETPQQLIAAAEKVRGEGYRHFDCHTPFPIHGLDDAMGIRRTILPWLVFGGGFTGCTVAVLLQWYTNAFDYPFLISGKPIFSLPANVPVIFELTVLLSAITAFGGMLVLNWLPEWYHPTLKSERFRRATIDRFFLVVEARDPHFKLAETREFFQLLEPVSIEELED